MSEFAPVTTLEDLASLDEIEVSEGYADGLRGLPEPHDSRSRSYAHGHKNGMIDSGRRQPDEATDALARAYVAAMRAKSRQAA